MHLIDTAERRRRLGVRHHLAHAARTADVVTVAGDVVGLHATDPASVYLGAAARVDRLTREDMATVLYDERSLLRILGMRETMFVVPRDLAVIVNASTTRAFWLKEHKSLAGWPESAGVADDGERWLSEVEAQTQAVLDELGSATATELTRRVPGLRVQIPFGEGREWAATVGISTRVLFLLATSGRIIRGRPQGTWLSSMYAWALLDRWVPGGLDDWPTHAAQAELVRRWLRTYGPGTQRDVQWWTGWTVGDTRRALAAVEAVEVALNAGTGWLLPEDLGPTADPGPWVALLPSLDSATMGWKERAWYLGDHAARLFDRAGNAGPTVWVDGRVVGGWTQRRSGEVVHGLLEDVGREAGETIAAQAARLGRWLGESRVTPRSPTPLDLELR